MVHMPEPPANGTQERYDSDVTPPGNDAVPTQARQCAAASSTRGVPTMPVRPLIHAMPPKTGAVETARRGHLGSAACDDEDSVWWSKKSTVVGDSPKCAQGPSGFPTLAGQVCSSEAAAPLICAREVHPCQPRRSLETVCDARECVGQERTAIGMEAFGRKSAHKLQSGEHHSSRTGPGRRKGESQRGGVAGTSFRRWL